MQLNPGTIVRIRGGRDRNPHLRGRTGIVVVHDQANDYVEISVAGTVVGAVREDIVAARVPAPIARTKRAAQIASELSDGRSVLPEPKLEKVSLARQWAP